MGLLRNIQRGIERKAIQFYLKSISAGDMLQPHRGDRAIYSEWDAERAVSEGYKASSYVYKAIERKAAAAASVPWKVHRLRNNKWEVVEGHPLEALLEQPNPFQDRAIMIERMIAHLDLAGNALLSKVRGLNNVVAELWPVNPQFIKPMPNKQDFIAGYEYREGSVHYILKPADVLHAMYVDPSNIYWGLSPIQVAAKTIDTDVEAVNWNKIALQNRAVTDGVLSFKEPLSRAQFDETKAQVREQKQGSNNARDLWVLGGNAQWQQMALNPVEMDFINSRKMTREEITSIFGVPLILLGVMEGSTYANYSEARKAFWEDTVIPLLNRLRAIFNQSLLKDFQAQGETLYIDYDLSNVPAMQGNFTEKVNNAKGLWAMGVPFNVINQRLEMGFDDIEGGDTGFIGSGLIPAGTDFEALAMEPPAPPEPPKDPAAAEDPGSDNEDLPEDDEQGKNKGSAAALEQKKARAFALKGVDLKTDEQKAIYWKSQERRRLAWYAKFTGAAAARFKVEAREVSKAYENGGLKAVEKLLSSKEYQEAWAAIFLRHYKGIVKDFGESAFNSLKSFQPSERKEDEEELPDEELPPVPVGTTFNPYDEIIQQYLIMNAASKVTGMLEFSKQTIAAIILDMRNDGAGMDSIARAIRGQFETMSVNRAFRIARTEVSAASNYGLFQAGKQSGVAVKKTWVNSADDRVRDAHDFRESVGMDDKFKNGLLYPGDMANGSAKEVIHCRCTLAYTTK